MPRETDFAEMMRESAERIDIDGTASQVGMSPAELRHSADHIEKLYRERNELLIYVKGLSRNAAELVKMFER